MSKSLSRVHIVGNSILVETNGFSDDEKRELRWLLETRARRFINRGVKENGNDGNQG